MIPSRTTATMAEKSKPRASGDDPVSTMTVTRGTSVNPARAGMIRDGR